MTWARVAPLRTRGGERSRWKDPRVIGNARLTVHSSVQRMRRLSALLLLVAATACTNAGVYALQGSGVPGPDRTAFEGDVCVPLAAGDTFPVKVLFLVEGGNTVTASEVGAIVNAIQKSAQRSSTNVKFALAAYHVLAQGLEGSFVDSTQMLGQLVNYPAFQEVGPVSMRSALKLAKTILSGDMQTSCRGTVNRTRYLIIMIDTSPDTSCDYPALNAGLSTACTVLPTSLDCSKCELTEVTGEIKGLEQQYGAGQVTIQPIHLFDSSLVDGGTPTGPDQTVIDQNQVISTSGGGTTPRVVDYSSLDAVLGAISFSSAQRDLTIKRFFAFNRNALSRGGQQLRRLGRRRALGPTRRRPSAPTRSTRTPTAMGSATALERAAGLDPLQGRDQRQHPVPRSSTTTPTSSTSARSGSSAPTRASPTRTETASATSWRCISNTNPLIPRT